MVWKRWVSLAKAQGDLPEAIKRCNEYLKVFQNDTSAVGPRVADVASAAHAVFLHLKDL